MAISSSNSFAAEIVAHRGASQDAPENTLSAFKLGYKQNADADELDIHLTKDGKIVVIHDYDTDRVAGLKKKVADQTFEEIRALDVGKWGDWKDKGFTEKIPTLDEVLALIPERKKLYIEIKCQEEILPALEKSLKKAGRKPQQTPIITFHYEVAKAAKARFPKIPVYWLVGWGKDKTTGKYPEIDDLIKKAQAAKVDGLDLNFGFPINQEFVAKVKSAGLGLYTWTVDDATVAKKEIEAGVDGVTTNRPEWLRAELSK
ncbi:MAG: glycerophosphodiester phosphodiesterase [Verrucomicrobiota bacterium]